MLFRIFHTAFLLLVVNAMHNVTVDDNNPSITYRPPDGWDVSVLDVLDAGGRHHVTADSDGTASFTFTGVAIYFYSPLWTFQVTTLVTLDSLSPVLLDLRDYTKPLDIDGPESVQSKVVWSHTGLANTKHTLLVSVGPGQTLAILDTLVYTVLDGNDVSSTSTSASSTSSSSSSSSTSSTSSLPSESSTPSSNSSTASNSSSKGLAVTLGVVCTVFGFLVITGIWWCIRRRRRRDDDYYDYPRTFNTNNDNDNNNSPQMSDINTNTNNTPAYNYSSRSSFPRGRDSRSRSRSTIIPTAQISARRKKNNLTNTTSRPSSSSSSSSTSSTTNRHYSTISHSSSSKMLKNNPLTPIPEALRETSLARSTMTYL